jgi:citrate synthase
MSIDLTQPLSLRVQSALAEALRLPPELVNPDLAFGDLPQWDSMGHMEVMIVLENRFSIEINAETIGSLTSIPAICTYIQENGHV